MKKLSAGKGIQSIWEYVVKEEYKNNFVKVYVADGEWSKLFRKCHGYIKTEMIQDIDNPNRFITLDYWQSLYDLREMKQNIAEEYKKLDEQCENYTCLEKHIGIFNS